MELILLCATHLLAFALGLWLHNRIYECFIKEQESKAARRVAHAVGVERRRAAEKAEMKRQLLERYGPQMPPDGEKVIDEEVEKILSGGPLNGRS